MAITTLRPNSVVIQAPSNLTLTGGGTVITEVNDNSDSTYVKGVSNQNYARWTLDDISLTGTQRVRSVGLRIRNARDSSGGTTQDTRTDLNSSVGAHTLSTPPIGGLASTRGTTAVTTFAGPLCYSGPGGVAWTQAVVNDLQIQVKWWQVHYGSAGWQRVYALYVDVDVNEQPSAGAVTVTNYTNNARPNVAWVYTDSDGDPQTRYQVKVFDAATYGSAGFSADTSTAAYDSGIISGDAVNLDLTSSLQNGVTYKAYVQAGQAWPGPEGDVWWSVWSVSSSFTVTFTPPPTPTVAVSLLSDALNYRAALAVTPPVNLLSDAAASNETNAVLWAADSNCTVTWVSTDAADGTHSQQMSSSASGNMVAKLVIDGWGEPRVKGGVTYTGVAKFHAAVSARSCSVGFRWLDSASAAIGADVYGSTVTDSASAGVYTQAQVTAAAPGNAVRVLLLLRVASTGGASELHRVDQMGVTPGSSTVWTPGSNGSQRVLYVERGERCDRRRGPVENWAHPQVASCGSQLRSEVYGFTWDTTKDQVRWLPADHTVTGGGPHGMLHWQPRATTGTATILRFGAGQYALDDTYRFPVVVGSAHVFSVWAWVASGTLSVTPKIEWIGDDGTVLSTTTGGAVTLNTTPQILSVSGTAPANASGAVGLVTNTGASNSADIYLTRCGWGAGFHACRRQTSVRRAAGMDTDPVHIVRLHAANHLGSRLPSADLPLRRLRGDTRAARAVPGTHEHRSGRRGGASPRTRLTRHCSPPRRHEPCSGRRPTPCWRVPCTGRRARRSAARPPRSPGRRTPRSSTRSAATAGR